MPDHVIQRQIGLIFNFVSRQHSIVCCDVFHLCKRLLVVYTGFVVGFVVL